jgi:hypothetical protein
VVKAEAGKRKGKGSGQVVAETGVCEDERSSWAERKGGGLEVRKQSVDDNRKKSRRVEGHVWVMSVIREQQEESERVIGE